MKLSLSIENFRKFLHLDSLFCNDITFIVGPNGSGKSSFTKALLLVISNLNNFLTSRSIKVDGNSMPFFHFDSPYYGNMHIDTFNRAICNASQKKEITLELSIYDNEDNINTYKMILEKSLTHPNKTIISRIEINSIIKGTIKCILDFKKQTTTLYIIDKNNKIVHERTVESNPQNTLDNVFRLINQLPNWTLEVLSFTVSGLYAGTSFLVYSLIKNISFIRQTINDTINKLFLKNFQKLWDFNLLESKNKELLNITKTPIDYIYTHNVIQKEQFSDKDCDLLSKTIISFHLLRCSESEEIKSFIKKWMDYNHFKIGTDFKISQYDFTNTYICNIYDNKNLIPIADKGIGQIQIMILLMRIGIAHKKLLNKDNLQPSLIIIEEPEQNMHPNMQSKLADLFKDAHDTFNIRFLIETHSEYLVRRSQALVSQMYNNKPNEFITNNVFKVIYFPEEGQPYDMQYKQNGFFIRQFQPGFIDEAGKWQMELIYNNCKND